MTTESELINDIVLLVDMLYHSHSDKIKLNKNLNRKIVSFQGNKSLPYYRWYKYKEAFSSKLVEYLFQKHTIPNGKVLDPFAGSGTALFSAASLGYEVDGIELLPVGQKIIEANIAARTGDKEKIVSKLTEWLYNKPWNKPGEIDSFNIFRITDGAYPDDTHKKIGRFLHELKSVAAESRKILQFSLLCILEEISYTRKDGQYLRWDKRSSRNKGKNKFDKGKISSFDEAIDKKILEMIIDLQKNDTQYNKINLLKGSCFDIMPKLKDNSYSAIITSPPYCNRYDYTRIYALEHAILGVKEPEVFALRQAMLSCTVENKTKNLDHFPHINTHGSLMLLESIISFLNYKKDKKELNNNGIVRMIQNYFYEMQCIIQECYRVLKKGGIMFMVNDNVRYAGIGIDVDIILATIAELVGFQIEHIDVLPEGKGASSQQMAKSEIGARSRKCVYTWIKN